MHVCNHTDKVGFSFVYLFLQDQNKREILKTRILPTMATNRTLQRVVTKYQLMLSEITAHEADSGSESDSVESAEE